jgi:hypothetical protein
VPRRKICGERKILLRKGISAKTRQLLLAANRYQQGGQETRETEIQLST